MFFFYILVPQRAIFKLVIYNDAEFQTQKFESSIKVANEIVKKIKFIMQMRTSNFRGQWASMKQQKLQRKNSQHHFPGFS